MKKYKLFSLPLGPYLIKVYRGVTDEDDDEHTYGHYDDDKQEIIIRGDIEGAELLADTFLHECIEAVNSVYDLGMEHTHIQTLGVALAQMIGPKIDLSTDKLTFDDDLPGNDGDGD